MPYAASYRMDHHNSGNACRQSLHMGVAYVDTWRFQNAIALDILPTLSHQRSAASSGEISYSQCNVFDDNRTSPTLHRINQRHPGLVHLSLLDPTITRKELLYMVKEIFEACTRSAESHTRPTDHQFPEASMKIPEASHEHADTDNPLQQIRKHCSASLPPCNTVDSLNRTINCWEPIRGVASALARFGPVTLREVWSTY